MITAIATERIWSPFQLAIYDYVRNETGSLIVEAVAGSGKTSTLIECAKCLTEWDSAVAIAFNTRIKDELVKKLPAYVPALTLNALGFRAWKAFVGKTMEVDGRKITMLVREMSDDANPEYRQGVKRLVDLAKMIGIVPRYVKTETYPLVEDTDSVWNGLIDEYSIGFGWGEKEERAIELARRVLSESIRVGAERIDFNDQLYLPVVFGADFPRYDTLFVDELQDLNRIQFTMIERSLGTKGRVIGFGDRFQGIYAWRGAIDAVTLAKERFNARTLPLSISYRCAKAIVRRAKEYMPAMEAWEESPEGRVVEGFVCGVDYFRPTDVILCRNNAPLVKMAFKLLRGGKACKVLGRDIGTGLVALVQRFRAVTVAELREKLGRYVTGEIARTPNDEIAVASLLDKQATLEVFIANCQTPAEVGKKIEALFSDEEGQYLTLATVFKYKGMEAERVFILDFELIGQRAKTEQQRFTERCVAGVAVTRAKMELYFIRS